MKILVNAILLVSIVVVLAMGFLSVQNENDLKILAKKKALIHLTLESYESLSATISKQESGLMGYFATPKKRVLPAGFKEKIEIRLADLKKQYGDKPRWKEQITQIEQLIDNKEALFNRSVEIFKEGRRQEAFELLSSQYNKELTEQFRRMFSNLIAEQDQILSQQDNILGVRTSVFIHITGSIFAAIIIFICLLLLNDDLRRREKTQKELWTAKEEALRASQAKSEFLSKMSHEIRTPLNAIIGGADALVEIPHNTEQGAYLRLIQKASESLYSLINQILDLSKIESGKVEIKNRTFNIRNLLSAIVDIFVIQSQTKNIDLICKVSPEIPAYIEMDPDKLRQVLINLISNAIKFTEHGQIKVLVEPAGEQKFSLIVRDTGIGMSELVQRKLFQKFSQGDDSITRIYGGSGLGLAITKELTELMGGTIKLKSQPEQGTEFSLIFPLRIGQKDSSLRYYETPPRSSQVKRLLIVDDNEENLQLLKLYLQKENYDISFASNGREAWEIFQREHFDLVFMDVHMPVMDGYSATQKIREWESSHNIPKTPVIALTADAMKEDFDKSLQAGCNAHLTKPIKKNDLIAKIEKFTHH